MSFYKFARDLVYNIVCFRYKMVVNFQQEIPSDKGYILACNHQSNLDPIFMAVAFKRQVNYMAKEELFSNKLLGKILNHLGTFKVSRGEGDSSAINIAIDIVKSNRVLGIFPEGTRSKDGKLKRAKSGTVVVAAKSGGDIIPVGISYKKGKYFRKIATVNFGCIIKNEMLKITDNSRAELKAASALLMENIALLIDNPINKDGINND